MLDFLFQACGQPAFCRRTAAPAPADADWLLLRQRRAEASLTQERLAELAGLSTGTIKGVEAGTATPTRSTLLRLLSVKELNLQPSELPLKTDSFHDPHTAPTSYFSPTYEPMRMFLDLVAQLNSEGRLYRADLRLHRLDERRQVVRALDRRELRADYRRSVPLELAAEKLGPSLGRAGIDLICLGAGDARQETRLMRALASPRPGWLTACTWWTSATPC